MTSYPFTHYQTAFRVEEKEEGKSVLNSLQRIVYGWLLRRERKNLPADKKNFFFRCDWRLPNSRSIVVTDSFLSPESRAWAMKYTHQDADLGPKRYWYTDIGIREQDGVAIFYARVSFARHRLDVTMEHPAPHATNPKFIRYILKRENSLKVYSGLPAFELFDTFVPIGEKHVCDMASYLFSRDRKYPLVIFNGDNPRQRGEARRLALALAGKAQVFVVAEGQSVLEQLNHYIDEDLWIRFGAYRVFFPLSQEHPRPERHRWYDPRAYDYSQQREALLDGLLRNHILHEQGAIETVSDVSRLIAMSRLRKVAQEGTAKEQDLCELFEIVHEVEKERDIYKEEAAQYASECDEKERKIYELKSKLRALTPTLSTNESTTLSFLNDLRKLPSTLEEVVTTRARLHEDRLIFADEAFNSAREYPECEIVEKAWEILGCIAEDLFNLKFGANPASDLAREFRERTGFEYAVTEGKQTKQDAALCRTRTIQVGGKAYEIWPHIKVGAREPKMLRIHFAFDEEQHKIVIGFVGSHMPNATSKTIK